MQDTNSPSNSAQPNSDTKNIAAYKITLSILFGLLGFGVNFFSIKFAFPPYVAVVLIGLLFPMLITRTWGWKYGLLSALAGGCQSMWWLWGPSNGYATFFVVPPFTLWIVWHGFAAGWRKKQTQHKWWLSAYIVEIPFRILTTINLYTLSRWAITLNPPPWSWASGAADTIPMPFTDFVVIKQAAVGYVILLLADVLLHLGCVRKFFGLEEEYDQANTNYIISASLLIGVFVWLADSVIGYLVFHTEDSLLGLLALNIPPHDVFMRTMFILACLMGGMLTSRLLRMQRKSDQSLLESEEHYRSLFDSVPIQLVETDLSDVKKYIDELREQGVTDLRKYFDEYPEAVRDCAALVRFVDINQASLEVSEMANKADFLENYDFGSETQSLTMFEEELIAFAGGDSVHEIEIPFVSPSGKMKYDIKRVSIPPAFAETWSRAVVSFTDITERVLAEEALRESEEKYRTIYDNAQVGLYRTMFSDGKVLIANQRMAELWGYESAEDCIAHCVASEHYADPETRKKLLDIMREHGKFTNFEARITKRDGTIIWLQYSGTLFPKKGYFEGVATDITERVRAEEEKRVIEAHLRQQQKLESIGTLASGVAHEINNPITGIMNYAQLISERLDPAQGQLREFAEGIIHETERVAVIVSNLLIFSRQEKQSHSPARIADIVNDTLSLIGAVIRRDQITLEVDIPDDLPVIKCRSQQIQQVLMNLLTNARDALNERYPEYDLDKVAAVTVRLFEKDDRRWLRTTVEDHGAGIPTEIMERIFDPFFTTKDRTKGTGLGLSISLGIVKDHHGELTFESEDGQPTRFYLDLPVDNGWERTRL